MKTRSLLTLAGLAIVLVVPAFALSFSGDVKALGEFNALGMKYEEAYNKNDAAALALSSRRTRWYKDEDD